MSTQFETILYERTDRILRITLNRPDKRNSLTNKMLEELAAAFDLAEREREVCAIVLRGAGDKAFCAGADLTGMSSGNEDGIFEHHESRGLFPKLFMKMLKSSKVTIASVNGVCVAGGLGLMLACDLAIAKSSVKFGTPEIARGLFPYMISALILRTVGRRKAAELMLLGDTFSAEEALGLGLVNKVVPDGELDGAVDAWAKKLATYSPAVLKMGRRALIEQEGMPIDGAFSYLQVLLTLNTMLDDAAEGVSAFFEKRPPVFKGR